MAIHLLSLCTVPGLNGENQALQTRMDELTKEKALFREELERRQSDLMAQIQKKKEMLEGQNQKMDVAVQKHAELTETKCTIETQIESLTKEMAEREEYGRKLDDMEKSDNLNIDGMATEHTAKTEAVEQLLRELNGIRSLSQH